MMYLFSKKMDSLLLSLIENNTVLFFACLFLFLAMIQWHNNSRKEKYLIWPFIKSFSIHCIFHNSHFPHFSFSYYLHTFKYYSSIQALYLYIFLNFFLLDIFTLHFLHPHFPHSAFTPLHTMSFPPNRTCRDKVSLHHEILLEKYSRKWF